LPPQIHERQLDGFGIRGAHVSLQQHDHAQQRGRMRLLAFPRVPIHGFELLLKRIVEQLVPMQPEKPEQRLISDNYFCRSTTTTFAGRTSC
jgi:hypothetical protein